MMQESSGYPSVWIELRDSLSLSWRASLSIMFVLFEARYNDIMKPESPWPPIFLLDLRVSPFSKSKCLSSKRVHPSCKMVGNDFPG